MPFSGSPDPTLDCGLFFWGGDPGGGFPRADPPVWYGYAQVLLLPPVGKLRLIDYYRSCDIVLDQFVYGYYGATALEAASIGKPVVMKLNANQYDALYKGDVMPVFNASSPDEAVSALQTLINQPSLRREPGKESAIGWSETTAKGAPFPCFAPYYAWRLIRFPSPRPENPIGRSSLVKKSGCTI